MAKTSTKVVKNYGTFSKASAMRTGWITVTKKHATREAARSFKRAKNFKVGILNLNTLSVIR
jgi:hypothetical protein